ncbi:MAG: hypothetical protein AAB373_00340 [Patescibacteria group bacterium]
MANPEIELEDVQAVPTASPTLTDTVDSTNSAANRICQDVPLATIKGDIGKAVSASQGDCEKSLPIQVNADCPAEETTLTSNVELHGQDATLLFYPDGKIDVKEGKAAIKGKGEPCIDQLPGSLTALGVHIDAEKEDGNVNVRFNIEEQADGAKFIRVYVFEGRAKITPQDGVTRELSVNEQILISQDGTIIQAPSSKEQLEGAGAIDSENIVESEQVYGDVVGALNSTVGQRDGGCETVKTSPANIPGSLVLGAAILGAVVIKKIQSVVQR